MFSTISHDPAERIADLDEQILAWRKLEYNASNMHNARGVGNCGRALEALYRERDGIVAMHPAADEAGRILGYRRRMAV